MSLARANRKYWNCRRCGHRNDRAHVKCRGLVANAGRHEPCEGRRPKRPVKAHQKMLRDHTYADYLVVAAEIHGVTDESCCACGKPRSQERHHDRDHDHRTARMRGLLCPGDTGCNKLLLPWITWDVATAIANAKEKSGADDWERWFKLAEYLQRVHFHYAKEAGHGERT